MKNLRFSFLCNRQSEHQIKKYEILEKVENLYLNYMYVVAKLLNPLVSVISLEQTSGLSMIFFSGVILYTIVRYFLNFISFLNMQKISYTDKYSILIITVFDNNSNKDKFQ